MILPPYQSGDEKEWLEIEDWGKQLIEYFNKNEKYIPDIISKDTFISIKK